MRTRVWIIGLILQCSLGLGCNTKSNGPTEVPAEQPQENVADGQHDHEQLDPMLGLLGPGRDAQRLSIQQIAGSFVAVLGQPWTATTPDGYRYPVEYLYGALGQPDYFVRLSEDLEPHLLFAKFLNEGAYAACGDAIEADVASPRSERHVMRKIDAPQNDRAAVIENLRDMRLRFHGKRVAPEDESSLDPWFQLFTEVSALPGNGPVDGWRAVCVAMVTDPEFALN